MICKANQWTGLHMIEASLMKELKTARIITTLTAHSARHANSYVLFKKALFIGDI